MKKTYKIEGMDCASCAKMIELDLEDAGINASCSFEKGLLKVDTNTSEDKVKEIVKGSGYDIINS